MNVSSRSEEKSAGGKAVLDRVKVQTDIDEKRMEHDDEYDSEAKEKQKFIDVFPYSDISQHEIALFSERMYDLSRAQVWFLWYNPVVSRI